MKLVLVSWYLVKSFPNSTILAALSTFGQNTRYWSNHQQSQSSLAMEGLIPDYKHVTDSDAPAFDVSEALVPPRDCKPAGCTNVSFDGLLEEPLLLEEDLKEGCGGQLWPAGMVLAKYLLTQHRSDLKGTMFVNSSADHCLRRLPN